MEKRYTLFATAPKGLEPLLADELQALGIAELKQVRAGVGFVGSLEEACRVCLWSRIANRVLLQLGSFPCTDADSLYAGIRAIDWSEHMDVDSTLAIDLNVVNSNLKNSLYGVHRVKDAIVDQFRENTGQRPNIEQDQPDIRVNVWLGATEASVSIDLSGDSLHKRGYRQEGVAAPLKENLAAAMLMRAGWMQQDRDYQAFVDPMCGSGTLPVEAALMAADIAPGIARSYWGFAGWKQFDPQVWEKLKNDAGQRRNIGLENVPPIRGYDRDARAVSIAIGSIERAGLTGYVHVERRELGECGPEANIDKGLVVVNPPYGERLGQYAQMPYLYRKLGTWMKTCQGGWDASLLTSIPEICFVMGLRAHKKHKMFNGALDCTLLHFTIGEAGVQAGKARPVDSFVNRLKKNLKNVGKWANREKVSCYRVYDADIPEYALAIDIYTCKDRPRVHVQEYAAPKTIDPDTAFRRLLDTLAEIPGVLELPAEDIYFKIRQAQKGSQQYQKQSDRKHFYEVDEYGCRLLVNLADYLDTGLFLDHRLVRRQIQQQAKGKRFLNLYAYTGTATVHAIRGGAKMSCTVDMSKTYLDWAEKNLELNGQLGRNHRLIRASVPEWLETAPEYGKYDLIFLDPPTFSNSKRMKGTLDIQRDHVDLVKKCMALLDEGGLLIFSNNLKRFRLDADALSGFDVTDISRATIPKDFERHANIHHCFEIRHKS